MFNGQADQLIDNVNATPMLLYFPPLELTPNGDGNAEPSINLMLGGKSSVEYLPGRDGSAGNNFDQIPVTGTVVVRAYWNEKSFDPVYKVDALGNPRDVCRVVSYTTDWQTLKNAQFAIIDTKRCIRISEGSPHGLFADKRYITTFWESKV